MVLENYILYANSIHFLLNFFINKSWVNHFEVVSLRKKKSCVLTIILHYGRNYQTVPKQFEPFLSCKLAKQLIKYKIPSRILSNENKKTGVSRKIVCYGILIHGLSIKTTETPLFMFSLLRFFD